MAAGPLRDDEFAALMERAAPFEPAPRVAVAVSGGGDSLCLALLMARWARVRGGEAVALTVDHGLRPHSAEETRAVGGWMAERGIPHCVLTWRGAKPAVDVQAAARQARYALLEQWCAGAGVLHLATAHNREDQAETLLLRLARGSGVDGLAAMAPVAEMRAVRLLRPLLDVPRARLRETLRTEGQDWIEDPSNENPAFSRVRIRRLMPLLHGEGMTAGRLAATASRLGRAREALESDCAALMAEVVSLHPAGFAWLDAGQLVRAPAEVGLRVLARLLLTVGAGIYPPRHERLQRLYDALGDSRFRSRTLGGCLVHRVGHRHVVCRELKAAAGPLAVASGDSLTWDERFAIRVEGPTGATADVGPLGESGWREVTGLCPELRSHPIPRAARLGLPALRDSGGVSAVPHLGYNATGGGNRLRIASVSFRPPRALSGVGFALFAGRGKLS